MAWFLLVTVVLTAFGLGVGNPVSAADDEGAKPAAAAAPTGEKTEAKPMENWFMWVARCSGLIGVVILLLSIYFVATVSRLFWEMRLEVAVPPEIVGRTQDMLGQRDFKGVFGAVKDDDSFFSRLLSTGITELPNGLSEARDVMERVSESIHVEMEKKISMLAVLGTLGPMIGLLGTLKGMIASFSVIARSDAGIKASDVAGGISEALLLTFEGVSLSVPAIFFYALFRNRVSSICTSATLEADQFLRHFAHAARAKAPAGGATAAAGAGKTSPRLE
jgi:biopolymer transport protein ExbB